MTEQLQSELIGQLKTEVHNSPDLTVMDDEQLRQLIARTLEEKIQWAGRNRPEAYRELASLNFREKRYIINAVYEAIRGLGVLGQIISNPDITEVMINGFEDIFVERDGFKSWRTTLRAARSWKPSSPSLCPSPDGRSMRANLS